MHNGFSIGHEIASPALVQRLDQVCDRFEAAWKQGQRPQIEEHLDGAPEPERSLLLRELIAVELHYRRSYGETIEPTEYQRRFPACVELMDELLENKSVPTARPSSGVMSAQLSLSPAPVCLGRYRVTGRIGSGSFGVVYQGRDDELRRDVAIKVFHRRRSDSPEDAQAYLAEARILAGLDHPGILPVHDVGRTHDGLCYLVTKLAAGSDLRHLIVARPPIDTAVEIVARIAEALHHAHQCGSEYAILQTQVITD